MWIATIHAFFTHIRHQGNLNGYYNSLLFITKNYLKMKQKLFTLLTLLLCAVSTTWADNVIFSLSNIVTTSHTVTGGEDYTLTNSDATISGGTVLLHNGHSDEKEMLNRQINLGGSGKSYMQVTLSGDNTIQIGDIINFGKEGLGYISGTTTKGDEINIESSGYVVPEESNLVGQNTIYYWKSSNTGGLSTFSSFTITRSTGTQAPNISFSGTTVTLTCATDGATIYYTTDGSTPTTNSQSKTTGQTFEIVNSCTVRAFAQKGEDASTETTKDCYVDHSGTDNFLTILKFNEGTVDNEDANLWKSTDGVYFLRNNNNPQTSKYTSLEAGNDAFKLSHVDGYTLTVPANVKITKVAFIGKSLYEGYTGTVRVTGFNSDDAKSFIEYPTSGIKCLSTIEFETNTTLAYGTSITFNPGGCESAAYIELYGIETAEPSSPVAKETKVQTVTFDANGAVCSDANIVTMSGGGLKDPTYTGYTKAMEMSSNATITINLPEGSTNASVTLFGTNASTTLKQNSNSKTSVTWSGDDTNGYTLNIPIADSNAGKTYTITKGDGASRIHKITLTYQIGSDDKISLTTTTNMAGWRAFYDADNSYSVDENTTVYVAASEPGNGKITLTSIEGIPAGVPVILHTTSSADSYKMTLTKATVDGYNGTNLLEWATSAVNNVYRLGYGADGVGFYPYSGTPTSGAVILNVSSANTEGAKALTFSFGDVTGISNAAAAEATNAGTGKMYNLSGQIVGEGYKGIVIVNGKKVIK